MRTVKNCVTDYQDINVSAKEISDAIGSLKLEKSCGKDCISAEHLKYSHMKLLDILSCLFTSMLSHGYLPKQMLVSVIVPVVKNKNSSLSSKNNYRPVALSSVISKVFEKLLLSRIEAYIKTSENQFGFKQGHGTELCVLTLKEIVRYYTSQGSNIFTCYRDASMAFDKISHILLFRKLFSRNKPTYLIRILWFWYRNQHLVVKWQNKFSEEIHVNNGVRQGGIISPLVFNVYMDNLSCKLNSLNIGCCFNTVIINHLMYADDLVLVAPSVKGLQTMLDITYDYGNTHCIKFNKLKSVCMHFEPKCKSWKEFKPKIWLGKDSVQLVEKYKYLGHNISADLTDNTDIQPQVGKLYARGNMLYRKFHFANDETRLLLFKSSCANIYCCSLWCAFNVTCMNKIRIAYNIIIMKLPR